MKIIIADDERKVRLSLKSMLSDIDLPINIIGEASNGEELLNLMNKLSPDVAFVDIKMPKMNGLEAIKAGKSISPYTKWIILTGFPQFDYAQEAIRLGTCNYLLKPVSPKELKEVLNSIIIQNENYLKIINQKFERDIISLYHDPILLSEYDANNIIFKSNLSGTVFYTDSFLDENCKAMRQRGFARKLRSIIDSSLKNNLRIALFNLPDGSLATISAWGFRPGDGDSAKHLVHKYFNTISQLILEISDTQFCITSIQTDESDSYSAFYEQLENIQELAQLRVLLGIGEKLTVKQLILNSQDEHKVEISRLFTDLCTYYNSKKYLQYVKTLDNIKKALGNLNCIQNPRVVSALFKYINCSINYSSEVGQSIDALLNVLTECGEQLLMGNKTQKASSQDLPNQVMAYIDDNYMNDVGIASIAELLDVTPNYLSSHFHKSTGTKFIDYLSEVRIHNAKKLLTSDPQIQINQVAREVGYYSVRHFTKLFVKYVGCYPSEYRKNRLSK